MYRPKSKHKNEEKNYLRSKGTMIEAVMWGLPRLTLWILLSIIPVSMAVSLDTENDVKNRGKVAILLEIIFFVLAPLCFAL